MPRPNLSAKLASKKSQTTISRFFFAKSTSQQSAAGEASGSAQGSKLSSQSNGISQGNDDDIVEIKVGRNTVWR